MAILKLGELVAGVRGTIGGTIYSANKAGPFARGWSRGSNPRTTPQTEQRALMSSHPGPWAALDQADRDDWDTYAADPAQELTNSLGEPYYVSGFNWYCRINTHLLVAGDARRATFPTNARPPIPTIDSVACKTPIDTEVRYKLDFPGGEFDGYYVIAYVTFSPSPALLWKSRGYLLATHETSAFWSLHQFGLTVRSLFGDPADGSKTFCTVQRQEAHGQRSAKATATSIVFD